MCFCFRFLSFSHIFFSVNLLYQLRIRNPKVGYKCAAICIRKIISPAFTVFRYKNTCQWRTEIHNTIFIANLEFKPFLKLTIRPIFQWSLQFIYGSINLTTAKIDTNLVCATHTDLVNHLQQLPVAGFCPSDSTSRRPCPLVLAFPACSFFGSFLAETKFKKSIVYYIII